MQFTKLFSSILDSTIWLESKETKLVWITMLAMCDRNGEIHASLPGLAARARVSIDECTAALDALSSPDPYSRTKDHEGRRIAAIDGGWRILNHAKYRALMSAEERREYNRQKQREYRSRKNLTEVKNVKHLSNNVNDCQQMSAMSTHTDADADADADAKVLPPSEVPPNEAAKPLRSAANSRKSLPDELFLAEIKRHYPNIDVDHELRKMDAWLLTRPGKQKTRKFIVNWLNRCDAPIAPQTSTGGKYDNAW